MVFKLDTEKLINAAIQSFALELMFQICEEMHKMKKTAAQEQMEMMKW